MPSENPKVHCSSAQAWVKPAALLDLAVDGACGVAYSASVGSRSSCLDQAAWRGGWCILLEQWPTMLGSIAS